MAYGFQKKFLILCALLPNYTIAYNKKRKDSSDYEPKSKMQKRPDFFLVVFQLLLVLSVVQLLSVSANIKHMRKKRGRKNKLF